MYDARHAVTNELVWKGLRILTNAPWMVALGRLCDRSHRHTQLMGQHTSDSAAYPWIFALSYAKQLSSATRWLALVKHSFPVRQVDPCMSCVRNVHYSGHWPDIPLTFLAGELDEARQVCVATADSNDGPGLVSKRFQLPESPMPSSPMELPSIQCTLQERCSTSEISATKSLWPLWLTASTTP